MVQCDINFFHFHQFAYACVNIFPKNKNSYISSEPIRSLNVFLFIIHYERTIINIHTIINEF